MSSNKTLVALAVFVGGLFATEVLVAHLVNARDELMPTVPEQITRGAIRTKPCKTEFHELINGYVPDQMVQDLLCSAPKAPKILEIEHRTFLVCSCPK